MNFPVRQTVVPGIGGADCWVAWLAYSTRLFGGSLTNIERSQCLSTRLSVILNTSFIILFGTDSAVLCYQTVLPDSTILPLC